MEVVIKKLADLKHMPGNTRLHKKKLMLADNRIAASGEEDHFAFEEALRNLNGDILNWSNTYAT